jgi:beta-N-acetylhexosaminidase
MRRALLGIVATALVVSLAACAPAGGHDASPTPARSTSTQTPSPAPTVAPAVAAVERMSVAEQAASVVMGHVDGTGPAALRAFMASGPDGAPLGGFILMGSNISGDAAQVRAVTAALTLDAALPPLIAIDQEGGTVSRLPWDRMPGGRALQADDAAQTQEVFAQRAHLVADTGADLNFGIIADVPRGPSSFIASRALGTDADDYVVKPFISDRLRERILHWLKEGPRVPDI